MTDADAATNPTPVILGYSEAAMFMRGSAGRDVRAVISIHGAREFGVDTAPAAIAHRLDLSFDDVDVPAPHDVLARHKSAARRRWAAENGLVEVPPNRADAESIIRFAEEVRDVGGMMLCHCGAGMSRSPAAALICLAVWRGGGCEMACASEALRLRPGAAPHAGLVQFADDALKRRGQLSDALRRR